MSRYDEACPIESRSRASSCQTCISTNGVPPCVAAYLSRSERMDVIPLAHRVPVSVKKAA